MSNISGFNTYGLHSVNGSTFNRKVNEGLSYPRDSRNVIVTSFRVHNLALRVMEYLPSTFMIAGALRIASGALMVGTALAIGNRNALVGAIIGRFYDETIETGIAQITRGVLTLAGPIGFVANAVFDLLATKGNISKTLNNYYTTYPMSAYNIPYREPAYPLLLKPLLLG